MGPYRLGLVRVGLVTLGSSGDVHPFVAVGRELVSRGHEVRLLVNEAFAETAQGTGIETLPMGEAWDVSAFKDHPDLLDAKKGPVVVLRDLVFPRIGEVYGATKELIEGWEPDIVVSHHIAMGVPWACRERSKRVAWASVLLSPLSWISRADRNVYPPVLPGWLQGFEPTLLPMLLKWRGDRAVNRIRKELGLPPAKGVIEAHARDADLHLGLWSPQLRAPTVDDPPRSHVTGFCHWDRVPGLESKPIEVERAFSGELAPILVCIGTAAVHIDRSFFSIAAEAAGLLRAKGVRNPVVLLGAGEWEGDLPEGVTRLSYAPFSGVMPRAAVNVIHGGAGSTGQAMRAGRPFVVVPFCNDQFDYGARAKRLKCARVLPRAKLTAESLAQTLAEVLGDAEIHERAARVAYLEGLCDGPSNAAGLIERFGRSGKVAGR